jgi:penicillin-binding protein 1A
VPGSTPAPRRAAAAARTASTTGAAGSGRSNPKGGGGANGDGSGRSGKGDGPKKRSFLWRWRRFAYAALVLVVFAIGGIWAVLNTIELPPAKSQSETTFVCAIDVPVGECGFDNAMARLSASEERVVVDYEDLPPVLVQAVLASEDRNFFDHNGVDPIGIARAFTQDVLGSSESKQGGSTITQQYVKSVYLTSERTLTRKVKEAVLAVKLEQTLDKREILTRYLNEVYFGRGAYGVEAASRAYFGVGVQDLTLPQAAYLAGLIRAPERADATRNPEEATRRRMTVLHAMVEEGYITEEQAEAADAVPWNTEPTSPTGQPQEVTILPRAEEHTDLGDVKYKELGSQFWVEWVRSQLRERFGPGAETKGLRVYTSFDPKLQKYAVDAVNKTLDQPDGPVGSLVAIDKDGRIRAMVGGRDYETSKVNLALGSAGGGSGRAPGSTFKPFALAAFVEEGYSTKSRFRAPATTMFPSVFAEPGKLWKPRNYDKADHGVQSVEEATWDSTNTVYAGIVDTVTPNRLAEMATRLGVRAQLDPVYSLVLGTEEVSVLDMASAYSTFANRGRHIEPYVITRIEDTDGDVLFDAATEVQPQQVISEEVADTVTTVLQGVILKGTGTRAGLKTPAAGKTGTTNDSKDAWFTGYTCNLTASVWMGYEQPREMKTYKGQTVAGGSFPAIIWRDFMSKATAGDAACRYPPTDAGTKILNSSLALSSGTTSTTTPKSSTTTSPDRSSTTTSTPSGSTSTTVPRSTTTAAPPTTAPAAPAAGAGQ